MLPAAEPAGGRWAGPPSSWDPSGVKSSVSGSPGAVIVRVTSPLAVPITDTVSESGLATQTVLPLVLRPPAVTGGGQRLLGSAKPRTQGMVPK